MTLKQQIEATIQAYEEACKPENLNLEYLRSKNLQFGICYYTSLYFYELNQLLINKTEGRYIDSRPYDIICNTESFCYYYKKSLTVIDCHQTRIQFLQKLLPTLPND